MKKALSILLIVAAVFGFYGGAVNIKDVLACKAYWEEEGRKTDENLNKLEDGINQLSENNAAYLDGVDQVAQGEKDLAAGEKDLAAGKAELATGERDYKAAPNKLKMLNELISNANTLKTLGESWASKEFLNATIKSNYSDVISELNKVVTTTDNQTLAYYLAHYVGAIDGATVPGTDVSVKYSALASYASKLADLLQPYAADKDVAQALTDLVTFTDNYTPASPKNPANANLVKLMSGVVSNVLNSKDISSKLSKAQKSALNNFKTEEDIQGLPIEVIYGGLNTLSSDLLPELDAARTKGIKDYLAAPKKLAAGRAALKAGIAQLADGRAQLADGKAQLAEYEDGEQQVRDGLDTLMSTEPNGGLTSIADRIGAGEDFNNEDGSLSFDKALNGVTEGRNYSADSGVVITKELSTRAIGTGFGLGAALLALIAAILCFAKKYKGAGVFAALTAICGVAGIAIAKSAGTEFSGLAGSPLSSTPYIAFAILAAIGVVATIADFSAKKA